MKNGWNINRRRLIQIGTVGVGALVAGTGVVTWPARSAHAAGGSVTDWFRAAHWGAFIHYLGGGNPIDWNNAVNAVDVNELAHQLHSVGAKYLIFTLGQNSGYYCSPNTTYDNYVGYTPSHCSSRDLIADIAAALVPKGIRLIAYLPAGAPDEDSQAMSALEWQRGAHRNANFQVKWENIIREWSLRWGESVGGWWFDGCFWPDALYNFADEPNWNSFAAAARAGNPHSLVAFNPGVFNPIFSICPQEDYTAGETNDVSPVQCPGRFVTAGANACGAENTQVQWHMLSYLAGSWGGYNAPDPRYTFQEAAIYTRNLVANQGVVSWDVPHENGSIRQPFVDQLRAIRFGLGISGNLAAGKAAELQSNAGYLLPVNSGIHYASNALDGEPASFAQAGEEWAWTLHTDLGEVQPGIHRVHVLFGQGYATEFRILLSTDQSTWTIVASESGWNGAPYNATFSPTSARYVRVKALAPNGPDQQGGQMTIAELQVFNNLALDTEAFLQDNVGNSLLPNAGSHFAANATDGNAETFAMGSGQWAWTLHDDLGTVRSNVNTVSVVFGAGGYATEFQILLSTDQSSWTIVASVSGWNGDPYTVTFSPMDARYVRVRALSPNGPDQRGGQMTISELGVYSA